MIYRAPFFTFYDRGIAREVGVKTPFPEQKKKLGKTQYFHSFRQKTSNVTTLTPLPLRAIPQSDNIFATPCFMIYCTTFIESYS